MAEIRVERKRTSLWPWIIGIILLALVIWAVVTYMNNEDVGTAVSAIELSLEAAVPALAA